MDLPSSSKNWDMPNFFPRMPMDMGWEMTPAGLPRADAVGLQADPQGMREGGGC
jgi:hypothetical protein